MPLARLISNTNRAIDPVASDVLDLQENILPQELVAAKCTPQGFLVIPKVVRVNAESSQWTRSGTWGAVGAAGPIEGTSMRQDATTNSFMEITIRARAFRLLFQGNTDKGIATITIDGSAPSTISGVTMEDGSAALDTIDTYRASLTDRLFFGYKGLSNAAHTVRVTVSGTKNAASSAFNIGVEGIEYVDVLADAADGVACNQVLVLPYGDREGLVDPADTAAITYVGSWSTNTQAENLMGQFRRSTTAADYFEITFTGTGIVLLFNTNTDRGFLDITLDAALVAKRWTAYQTGLHYNYPFPILGLSAGSHTVRVTVNAATENGGDNIIDFAGFFVVKDADDLNGYGGVLVTMGKRFNKTGLDSVTMAAADASNPRKDLLVVDDAGVFSIIQGTAAAAPSEPAEPTDDRVPLAILTQEKSGILLQRLHAPTLAGGASGDGENEAAILRQVQDRRRGILSSFGEVPIGIRCTDVLTPTPRFRLPRKAKRLRIRKTVTTSRVKIVDSDASPERAREFDDIATAPQESFINVDGFGGKTVHLAFVSGTAPSWDAISVM